MPGFVDVTGWSDNDIKRLGQRDDDDFDISYRNPYAYRKPFSTTPKFAYDAELVWTASVLAYRANCGYVKAVAPDTNKSTNRQLMEQYLKDNVPFLAEDIEEGRKIRQYFKGLTFKVLEGKTLTPFLQSAMQITEKDQITSNLELATIASLPATYEKMASRDDVERRIKWATGGNVGTIGDKVTAEIEVVKQIWSQNWNTYYITGITDDDKVLFFAYKTNIEIGDRVKITGTVKGYRDNTTQLNRVKVIK